MTSPTSLWCQTPPNSSVFLWCQTPGAVCNYGADTSHPYSLFLVGFDYSRSCAGNQLRWLSKRASLPLRPCFAPHSHPLITILNCFLGGGDTPEIKAPVRPVGAGWSARSASRSGSGGSLATVGVPYSSKTEPYYFLESLRNNDVRCIQLPPEYGAEIWNRLGVRHPTGWCQTPYGLVSGTPTGWCQALLRPGVRHSYGPSPLRQ